jgi:hypothetical protein
VVTTEQIIPATPEVTGYDTDLRYYATRYKQGGRLVYALDLSLDQVRSLVPRPNPDEPTPGNRAIRPAHAASFARYIREHPDWVSPAMLFRAPNVFKFEAITHVAGAEFGVLSFPRTAAKDVKILDGQHRTLGFYIADETIDADLEKARNHLAAARRVDPQGVVTKEAQERVDELLRQRDRLAHERISLQIFIEDDPAAFKQMFFDIADNALGITASVKARFDTRKVVNRALEDVLEHPLLKGRVDLQSDRIGRGSKYLMTAKHVRELTNAVVVGLDGRVSKRQEATWKESDVAARTKEFLDLLVDTYTPLRAIVLGQLLPDDLRKSSLLGSILTMRILAGVYHDLQGEEHQWSKADVREYLHRLAPHMEAPVYPGSIWLERAPEGSFTNGAVSPSGRRQDLKGLKNALVSWALDRETFIDQPPAPRPEPVAEWVDPELGAGYKGVDDARAAANGESPL